MSLVFWKSHLFLFSCGWEGRPAFGRFEEDIPKVRPRDGACLPLPGHTREVPVLGGPDGFGLQGIYAHYTAGAIAVINRN